MQYYIVYVYHVGDLHEASKYLSISLSWLGFSLHFIIMGVLWAMTTEEIPKH